MPEHSCCKSVGQPDGITAKSGSDFRIISTSSTADFPAEAPAALPGFTEKVRFLVVDSPPGSAAILSSIVLRI
jgi:hypothetical protein